ncbi:MAG: hypothetical protein AB1540_10715, partial [Bdellovibrionota bacterium]
MRGFKFFGFFCFLILSSVLPNESVRAAPPSENLPVLVKNQSLELSQNEAESAVRRLAAELTEFLEFNPRHIDQYTFQSRLNGALLQHSPNVWDFIDRHDTLRGIVFAGQLLGAMALAFYLSVDVYNVHPIGPVLATVVGDMLGVGGLGEWLKPSGFSGDKAF